MQCSRLGDAAPARPREYERYLKRDVWFAEQFSPGMEATTSQVVRPLDSLQSHVASILFPLNL
jgi:hypothetical protein